MADQPQEPKMDLRTAPKQLYQIGWEGGMTEGDVGPQTVQDLLNVELDIEGQLYPRKDLVEMSSAPNRTWSHTGVTQVPIDVKYMQKPTDATTTYRVQFATDAVTILKDSDNSTIATMTFATAEGGGAAAVDITSTMTINGSDIFIAAIDPSTKLPLGVFKAVYINSVNRWRLPLYTDGTNLGGEVPYTARWIMLGPDGLTPVLDIVEVTEVHGYNSSNTRDAFYSFANTKCGITKSKVTMACKTILDRDMKTQPLMTVFEPLAVERTYSVDFAVQFVFQDGSHSRMSDPSSYTADTELEGLCVGIGFTIAVNTGISASVRSINVYRRVVRRNTVVDYALDFELMFTADLSTDDIAEKDVEASEGTLDLHYFEYGASIYGDRGLSGIKHLNVSTGAFGAESNLGRARSFAGDISYTSGWFKCATYSSDNPDTYLMVFCPKSLIASGIHTYWFGNIPDDDPNQNTTGRYYKLILGSSGNPCVSIYGHTANVGSNVVAIGSNQYPVSPLGTAIGVYRVYPARDWVGHVYDDTGSPVGTGTPFVIRDTLTDIAVCDDFGGTILFQSSNSSIKYNYDGTAITATGSMILSPTVLSMFVDNNQAGFSVENVSGITDQERSVVRPRKIAFGAGRMVCLNVVQDGVENVSRLAYSDFRRFTSFRKTNYIDYDVRDDGRGVAIVSFAGRILVLHSTSSYILDISGGNDMSWRELGAYNDVGVISELAVVSTNVGIFFGSYSDVYWFDGTKLVKITELEGRRVSTAYRAMDKSKVSLVWRGDLRQLWVCERLSNILVFDMDRGAWHRHVLSEISGGANTTPIRFNNVANVEFLTAQYKLLTADTFYAFRFNPNVPTSCQFQWGITTGLINMGASEIIKKSKSFYLDLSGVTGTAGDLDVWYTNVGSTPDKSITPGVTRAVHRIRTSVRRGWLNFKVLAKLNGSTYWRGSIESLGLSYKPKRLK